MQLQSLHIISIFIAGVVSFFSPCILPLLPVYVSVFASGKEEGTCSKKKLIINTILFVAGLSTSFIILGFGAGILGTWMNHRFFFLLMGGVVVLLGVHQTGFIRFGFLEYEKRLSFQNHKVGSYFESYILGFTFSFGWTPCVGPVLAAVLGLAAGSNGAFYGGFFMFIYSLGFLIPFLGLAISSDFLLKKLPVLKQYGRTIKVLGGLIVIGMGILLMINSQKPISTVTPQMTAPPFEMETINGERVHLSDFEGKPVYVKFWASWCSICLASLEEVEQLSAENNTFEVITVVSPGVRGEKSEEDFKTWFEKLGFEHMTVLLDSDGIYANEYGVRAYPSSAYITSDGKLEKFVPGYVSNEAIKETFQIMEGE